MTYRKIPVLAAVVALAMMAFAGSASATALKNNGVDMKVGDSFSTSVTNSSLFKTGGGSTIATCTGGTIVGTITNGGGAAATVSASIDTWTWSGCNTTIDILATGTLEVHHIAGTDNGIVTSSGMRVTTNFLGVSCTFETSGTAIGTLTEGKPAALDINGTIPGISGFPCSSTTIWSGGYTITNPSGTLQVAAG